MDSAAVARVRRLRAVGITEGVSYLVLLLIAMPLKYVWFFPLPVRIVGALHGGLFVWFCWCLQQAHLELRWPLRRSAGIFLSSLVPFGFFLVERLLQREMRAGDVRTGGSPAGGSTDTP